MQTKCNINYKLVHIYSVTSKLLGILRCQEIKMDTMYFFGCTMLEVLNSYASVMLLRNIKFTLKGIIICKITPKNNRGEGSPDFRSIC